MLTKPIILLFLAVSISFATNYSFLMIPAVSSVNLPLNPASAVGQSAPDPPTTGSFPTNMTLTGNLVISGNNVVNFAGISSSLPEKVYLNGSIYILDNATLVLKYTTLYFIGATKPYSRNITLSYSVNGHPRLNISNAVIDAYTWASQVYGHTSRGAPLKAVASYGAAVYAYNNSEITSAGLSFYREKVYSSNSSLGGPTLIKSFETSSVDLTNVKVDSVLAYDEGHVSIYTGSGPKRTSGTSPPDAGVSIECHNSSMINLNGVTFQNALVVDNAHLTLTHCTELNLGIIQAKDQSRVDVLGGTTIVGSFGLVHSLLVYLPGINESGYSYVSFSSSTASSASYLYPVVSLYDHATFAVVNSAVINPGKILTYGYSRMILNNSRGSTGLVNTAIECHDSSSASIFNSTFNANLRPVSISLFDNSNLSLVDSLIYDGLISVSKNATAYISGSYLKSVRLTSQNNANVTITDGCYVDGSVEMSNSTRLGVESSSVSMISCLGLSQVSLVGGSVTALSVQDNSSVYARNSTLGGLSLFGSNVTGSISEFTGFLKDSTLSLSGIRSQISVLNTTVNGLDLSFSGYSNVTVSNSTIRNLSLQGSSFVVLNNASVYGSVYVVGNSRVFTYSPFRVHCVDYFGNPLDGTVITVKTGYFGAFKVIKQQTADRNGWGNFVLFSEMDNVNGSFPFGIVTVSGDFGSASVSQQVSLAAINKDVTLSFPLPSWSGFILPVVILVGIVVLLTLLYYVRKRIHGNE